MSNTAIQKVISAFDDIHKFISNNGDTFFALNLFSVIIKGLIEREKCQIIDAYNQGYRDGESDAPNTHNADIDIALCSNAEDYFNEKYGQP